MKKDRNSFFSQYGMSSYNVNTPFMYPNTSNMNVQNANGMVGAAYQPQMPMAMPTTDTQEIEARLNKIERELSRIDTRLNKLESLTSNTNISNTDYNFANSMYMV